LTAPPCKNSVVRKFKAGRLWSVKGYPAKEDDDDADLMRTRKVYNRLVGCVD
jgi:hypothetical protein